ncbi:hypothetical protein L6R53_02825 [Myxococcota bacterium]|nr:hypothetical protein [Myxococcota bacterium]
MPALLLALLACSAGPDGDDSGVVAPQPLDLPEDPAAWGVPVGVRTETMGEVVVELWYPADDAVAGQAGEVVDATVFVPDSVQEHIGPLTLPGLPTLAVRDAPLRPPEAPYPVVFFSHGFGGFRQQSVDLTTHLASRGYVVISADHPGRMLGDVLPCLFSPPLEGCDLTGFTEDPAQEDLDQALALLDQLAAEGWLAGAVDTETLAIAGHSAGAGSTTTWGQAEPRIDALLPLAGGAAVTADLPTAFVEGTCDPYPGMAAVTESAQGSADATLVAIAGAGHLAFSDLCELELGALAKDYLEGRDDLNDAIYAGLVALATDGCPGAAPDPSLAAECGDRFLDLSVSDPIVRHVATTFLDQALRGQGAGVDDGGYAQVQVSTP